MVSYNPIKQLTYVIFMISFVHILTSEQNVNGIQDRKKSFIKN